jgi:hypothetical protein
MSYPGRHGLLHEFFHHEHFTLQILFSNKTGISIIYFQNCISVFETFIILYITYTYQIDDLFCSFLYFWRFELPETLMEVIIVFTIHITSNKCRIARRERLQQYRLSNFISDITFEFINQTLIDLMHVGQVTINVRVFLHLGIEKLV